MLILVINCGSSSLKYQLMDMNTERPMAKGLVERIGIEGSVLTQKANGKDKYIVEQSMDTHKIAIKLVLEALTHKEYGVISSLDEIAAIGHRVVHGGERYSESIIVNDEVKEYIKECFKLAPLHNPAHIIGIEACEALMPNVPMVVVFDNSFHSTIPEEAYIYPLPYELYKKHGIRKYGFHGTSHKYVSKKAADIIGKNLEDLKIVTCHLGNGASLCAVNNGFSVDTSMGFTPLEGVAMGTRSGSIDPAIVTFLMREEGLSVDEIDSLLNRKSGVLGISGVSSDFRDLEDAAFNKNNYRANLALNVFKYKVKTFIGAYAAAMGGIDVVVFTAGVGENGPETRRGCLEGLDFLGIELDDEKNKVRGELQEISKDSSRVKVFVIPTNEELVIARDTMKLIQ